MTAYPVLCVKIIQGQAGHREMRTSRCKTGDVTLVRGCPRPRDNDCIAFLQYRHQSETLIGKWAARSAHTLFKTIATQRLAVPWIARIVANNIGFSDEIIARIYSALGPNLFNKRG